MRTHSRGMIRPGFAKWAPRNSEGAGKAGCLSHPLVCSKKKHTS